MANEFIKNVSGGRIFIHGGDFGGSAPVVAGAGASLIDISNMSLHLQDVDIDGHIRSEAIRLTSCDGIISNNRFMINTSSTTVARGIHLLAGSSTFLIQGNYFEGHPTATGEQGILVDPGSTSGQCKIGPNVYESTLSIPYSGIPAAEDYE